jgi:2-polyprenyl-6-methoxyphenol hydroxylase-like FAD-dependent oxidoreductase
MDNSEHTRVLIAGAGPTGLMLACELARRGVAVRVVDAAREPFRGSRGKGLQPRTLEIFHDLGILPQVLAFGGPYLPFRMHVLGMSLPGGRMSKPQVATPDVPYPNIWMIPQWRTEQLLRERLAELGVQVELGVALSAFTDEGTGIRATLESERGQARVRCDYLVGCDGGHSFVRKALGVPFEGEAIAGRTVVVADVVLAGLARTHWHVWPFAKRSLVTLCPLPGTADFQLAAPLRKGTPIPELNEPGIQQFLAAALGGERLTVERVTWASLYRPQVRMVDRMRVGCVLLAGDAAHVHPPTGGQGLNTGIQDAYNLGWKLAAVIAGAPASLLDSYEAERLPVAASVLGLSKRLQQSGSARRGRETQQLDLSYRDGPLAEDARTARVRLRAGDRAPDAPCTDTASMPRRLFDEFRGTHWTLLLFGARGRAEYARTLGHWGDSLRIVGIEDSGRAHTLQPSATITTLVDPAGHARDAYAANGEAAVLVRPDGYIAHFGAPGKPADVERFMTRVAPAVQA